MLDDINFDKAQNSISSDTVKKNNEICNPDRNEIKKDEKYKIPTIHINIPSQDSHNILMKYNEHDKRFSFYDKSKNFMGSMSIVQIIKYLTNNISKSFLKKHEHESAIVIIEKYY